MIMTCECKVKVNDIIPFDEISDHDSSYIFLNARISTFQPRFKYVQDLLNLVLPLNIIYTTDTVDDKVDLFNKLK